MACNVAIVISLRHGITHVHNNDRVPYISELKQGTNRSLVSFTSLVISSDNVNRGLVLLETGIYHTQPVNG